MNGDIDGLVRSNIRALKPYRAARHDFHEGILLDANENAFGSAVQADGVQLNRYPDPYQKEVRRILAGLMGVQPENIFAGVGSDEVIDLLFRIFCEPRVDNAVLLEPTYGMYRVAASIQDVETRSVLLDDEFQIDVAAVLRAVDKNTKLIFCCSPNNPTSNLLHPDDIIALCEKTSAIVVVDEAYHDFAQTASLASKVKRYRNLVVLRTLSKAWGMAGVRFGYCAAEAAVIDYLLKVKAPYNLNVLTGSIVVKALANSERMMQSVDRILAERDRLAAALKTIPGIEKVYPSDANFLLVRCTEPRAVYRALADRGIIVRDRSSEPKLQGCLRITVGLPEENRQLIDAWKDISR